MGRLKAPQCGVQNGVAALLQGGEIGLQKDVGLDAGTDELRSVQEAAAHGADAGASAAGEAHEERRAGGAAGGGAEERGAAVDCFQSNHEGALIDRIHEAHGRYDGIVYNPGAHTHYSWALADAIGSVDVPMVEVHISDVDAREDFRKISVFEGVRAGLVKGKGRAGYTEAVDVVLGL